jgi:predicted NBD/HSP70 family sugar kinase
VYLVIDIGGTEFKYALMDVEANVESKGSIKAVKDSYELFLEVLIELYNDHPYVEGVAISIAGIVDSSTGYCFTGGSLEYYEKKDLVADLRKGIDVPITIENDAKSAGLAEVWKGNLVDSKNAFVLTIGTSVGGCVVIDGKVHRGSHQVAGEVWTNLDNTKVLDTTYCWGHQTRLEYLLADVAKLKNVDVSEMNGKVMFEYASNGDQEVIDLIDDFTKSISGHLFSMQGIIDPDTILIGGGISKQPLLIELINKNMDTIYSTLEIEYPRAKINTCKFYNDSNLIGALYHHLDLLNQL